MQQLDCRDEVFRERGHEVLTSVVQGTQMALPDPYDVEELHLDARQAFNATLDDVRSGSISRILLIDGEAGCGKTHLIRALRTQTHRQRRGVIAYVHMTSESGDYRRYLLRQVVRSLSDAYLHVPGQAEQLSALELISDALADSAGLEPGAAEILRGADESSLAGLVSDYADALSGIRDETGRLRYEAVDLNMLRTFLYRQSGRKPIQRRVSSVLNGEPLSGADWQKLSALPPDWQRDPMYLLGQLARMVVAALNMPLVICVDQIEASDITGKNHEPFKNAMGTACELIENIPKLMVLLSCLDSAYSVHAPHLIASYRHRIENEPGPVTLIAARSAYEIRQIVSRRLKGLYEGVGLQHVPPDSVYPMPEILPDRLARQHLRDVLQQVHRYWQACRQAGAIVHWEQEDVERPPQLQVEEVERLRLAWNEFLTNGEHKLAEEEAAHLDLLRWALTEVPNELSGKASVRIEDIPSSDGDTVPISFTLSRTGAELLQRVVGLCERDARGNGLYKQVTVLEGFCTLPGQTLAVLRSTRFPRRGKLADYLAELRQNGSVTQVIEETCWQTMQAMREFIGSGSGNFAPDVVREWRTSDMPLAGSPEMQAIIQGRPQVADPLPNIIHPASLPPMRPPVAPPQPASTLAPASAPTPIASVAAPVAAHEQAPTWAPSAPIPLLSLPVPEEWSVPVSPSGPLVLGMSDGFISTEVTLEAQLLTRHTAIFGANGSGKTVLALNIVEQLLERGIGVVLFDRKGDLATYAVEEAWTRETGAPDETNRRRALRERLDIALYTPGSAAGRPLVLPLLPETLGTLNAEQSQEQCRDAALILCHVCGATPAKADLFAAVLSRAIELLCTSQTPHTLDNLEHILLTAPTELLDRLPAHTARHCEEVGRRLNEKRVAHGRLFSDQGEKVDLQRMLMGSRPGRVSLNIICTEFLGDDSSLAWVAQFLTAAGRFIQRFPSEHGRLQGVLMFDEADQYIPASSKPVTKPAMDNLLRRARAAGVGVMLATQNVGDFDYKALDNITTTLAGKMGTKTALEKLRSTLGGKVERLSRKAPGHFVMGVEGNVQELKSHMCLIRPSTIPRDQIERIAGSQVS